MADDMLKFGVNHMADNTTGSKELHHNKPTKTAVKGTYKDQKAL
jgi:hypothetical protein